MNEQSGSNLLKCFCECSFYTRDVIQNALQASPSNILSKSDFRKLFKGYLKTHQSNFKTKAEKYLENYIFCEEILSQALSIHDAAVSEQLEEYCFTEEWEDRLEDVKDDDEALNKFLVDMMKELVIRFGNLNEFTQFKIKLKEKLK